MPVVRSQDYVFDPRPHYPFCLTATRYWVTHHDAPADPDALTLILAHAMGFHKETWFPVVQDLYDLLGDNHRKIQDIWSIEAPNHGESAVLNEDMLSWGCSLPHAEIAIIQVDWQEYGRSIHLFLAGLGTGVDVDFSQRKLVGIGHSIGGVAMTLVETWMPKLRFESMILLEPMILPPPEYWPKYTRLVEFFQSGGKHRRDIWSSRVDALADYQSKRAFKQWDQRVVALYVKHGLRDLPSATYPDAQGVTLRFTKAQERASTITESPGRIRAWHYLPTLCAAHPVHFMWGMREDYWPHHVKETIVKVGAQGMHASVSWIEDAGHLAVQMQPRRVAVALAEKLGYLPSHLRTSSVQSAARL